MRDEHVAGLYLEPGTWFWPGLWVELWRRRTPTRSEFWEFCEERRSETLWSGTLRETRGGRFTGTERFSAQTQTGSEPGNPRAGAGSEPSSQITPSPPS